MQTISPLRALLPKVLVLALLLGVAIPEDANAAYYGQSYQQSKKSGETKKYSKKSRRVGRYRATKRQKWLAHQRALKRHRKVVAARKKPKTRYVAVRTFDPTREQLAEISRNAGAPVTPKDHWHCVMIWDTYSKQIVGNDCYATPDLPPPGAITHFDTYTAEYIGTGD